MAVVLTDPAPGAPSGPDAPARLHLVVPGDVDAPTGGSRYDRRLHEALRSRGVDALLHPVVGAWPGGAAGDAVRLDALLRSVPDGAAVLLDGLVACGVPGVVVPHAGRLRLSVLLHLPLGSETGLDPDRAARLDARERQVLAAVDRVVVTSPWTARWLAGRSVRTAPVVAEPGTDPAPPAGPDEPGSPEAGPPGRRLLCLGSVGVRKQQRRLVAALAGLPGPWHLRLVGAHPDPVELERLRRDVASLPPRLTVEVTGPQQGPDLERQWRWADLLVVPSVVETYGMVVGEALARGLPVLASTGGALPETLGTTAAGPPGLLVAPQDTDALAAALRTWGEDAGLRGELSRRARERGRDLPGWDATAAVVASALLGAGAPGPRAASPYGVGPT